jgi:hypothetical protein
MTVSLLRLKNGHVSFEYETDDKPIVHSAIRELYGAPLKISDDGVDACFRIGRANLIYFDEWDYPCLISGSKEGDAVLTALHRRITASPNRRGA